MLHLPLPHPLLPEAGREGEDFDRPKIATHVRDDQLHRAEPRLAQLDPEERDVPEVAGRERRPSPYFVETHPLTPYQIGERAIRIRREDSNDRFVERDGADLQSELRNS